MENKKLKNFIIILISFFLIFVGCGLFEPNKDDEKKVLTNLVKEEKYEQAITFLNILIKKYPNDDEFPAIQSGIYHGLGRDSEAIEAMIKAIKINPKIGTHHANLGFIFYKSDNCNMAIHPFEKAVEFGGYPDDCMVFYALGVCSSQLGYDEKAYSNLLTFINNCKDNKDLLTYVRYAESIISSVKNKKK
jgi:tetratricopeptide (TPR) repeat protein